MPKKINDLKKIIIKNAINIFLDEGFDAIEMRRVAKEANIAVGTLYNYFPSKKELMRDIFIDLWQESLTKLQKIIEEEKGQKLLDRYIEVFYQEMMQKKGIGKQLFKLELIEDNNLLDRGIGNASAIIPLLVKQVTQVLLKSYSLNGKNYDTHQLEWLTNTTVLCLLGYSKNYNQSSIFIRDLIDAFMKQKLV